jgi:hypothetical protein
MQNIIWLLDQIGNPFFLGFVVCPILVMLASWPAVIGHIEERKEQHRFKM